MCNAKEKMKDQKIYKKGRSSPLIYFYSDTGRVAVEHGGLVFFPQKKDKHKHLASRKELTCLVCAFLLFRWLLLSDSLRLGDKKKYFKAKRKTLFYFKIFTYRGEKIRKDERVKAGNKDKEQCIHRINSNLPGGSIARREKEYCFL